MWEPVGPLPASVYWRRRWVALASAVGVLLGIVWSVAALLAPAGDDAVSARAALAAAETVPATEQQPPPTPDPAVVVIPEPAPPGPGPAPDPAPDPASVPAPARIPAAAPAPPTAAPAGKGPGPASASAPPTLDLERLLPDETPRRVGPAPTPVPVPATGPEPCVNAMLAVTTEVAPATHRVGDRPVLRLVVTNVSDRPCVRDLDPIRQEIVVWGVDGARLWSSNDCSTVAGVDLRTLVPGQPVAFAVNWAGRTSAPGCTGPRTDVPAGGYNVMTRVDDVISPPVPITRTL